MASAQWKKSLLNAAKVTKDGSQRQCEMEAEVCFIIQQKAFEKANILAT